MARSTTKRRKSSTGGRRLAWGGTYSQGKRRRDYVLVAAAIIVVAVGAALYWWRAAGVERAFLELAAQGRPELARVQTFNSEGREHLDQNVPVEFPGRFPTSGNHYPVWADPGFYNAPQAPELLVHAAEHGNIVIYYDRPGDEAMAILRGWTNLYNGRWDGVVVTPMPGLGTTVVVTAWTKRMTLEQFDPAAAAAFVDAYRGRGPEHPVR